MKMQMTKELIEKLAELEHEQWIAWSKDIASKEKLSEERLKRWQSLWIPYEQLSEEMKEHDRKWARKSLAVMSTVFMLLEGRMEHFVQGFSDNKGNPIGVDCLRMGVDNYNLLKDSILKEANNNGH